MIARRAPPSWSSPASSAAPTTAEAQDLDQRPVHPDRERCDARRRTPGASPWCCLAILQAYYNAPIYSRVPGYLQAWYVDIGAQVKAGQLLATIDTPELDQQLAQARADLATAQANMSLAATTAAALDQACWPRTRSPNRRPTRRPATWRPRPPW